MKFTNHIGLQYFAEPPAEPTEPPQLNFEELMKTNPGFRAYVENASNAAVLAYQQKQQKLNDDKVSEAEKLKTMTADEKAEYYRQKFEAEEKRGQQFRDAESLKQQTAKLLSERGIPSEFLDDFDFTSATAESVKKRVEFLGGYEIYAKGTFEKKLNAALDEKLRQKQPQTGAPSAGTAADAKTRAYFGLK